MWMRKMKKELKDPFIELLKVIAWRQEHDEEEEQEGQAVINVPEGDLPPATGPSCLFCGETFNTISSKREHMKVGHRIS